MREPWGEGAVWDDRLRDEGETVSWKTGGGMKDTWKLGGSQGEAVRGLLDHIKKEIILLICHRANT